MPIQQLFLGGGGLGEDVYWWNIANNTMNLGGKAVAVDNSGNLYVASAITGLAKGQVTCFDKEGDILWTHKDDSSYFEDIAVDNLGHVYALSGSIWDTTNGIGQNDYQPILVKLNTSDGSEAQYNGGSENGVDWRKMFHTTYNSTPCHSTGVRCDSSGNPIVACLPRLSGVQAMPAAVKFNKDTGAATWATRLEDSDSGNANYMNEDGPGGIAIDSNDNVILCGWKTTSFGLTNSNYGFWVTKIASDGGSITWKKYFAATGGANQPISRSKCFVDKNDNVYVSANWTNNITPDELYTLVVKLDSSGDVVWARAVVSDTAAGSHIKNASNYTGPGATDSSGNVFISAWVANCQSPNMGGSGDDCIYKFDSDGNNLEVIAIGNNGEDYPGGLAVNKLGNIVIAAQSSITTSMNILVAQLPGDMSITGGPYNGYSANVYVTKPSSETSLSTWTNTNVMTDSTLVLTEGGNYGWQSYDDFASEMTYATNTATPGTGEDPGAPITIS